MLALSTTFSLNSFHRAFARVLIVSDTTTYSLTAYTPLAWSETDDVEPVRSIELASAAFISSPGMSTDTSNVTAGLMDGTTHL